MNEVVHSLGRKVFRTAYSVRRPSGPSYRAAISTNSAIHRGLRKSTSARGRNPSAFGRDVRQPSSPFVHRNTRHGQQSDQLAPRAREWPRVPRPDHLGKQDVEDMRESARAKELARSPRQRKYLDGGRRPQYDQSFPSKTYFRDRERSETNAPSISRATDRYAKTKSDSYGTPASIKPNRAARRLAMYGPGDTPPSGTGSRLRTRDSRRDPEKYSRSHEEDQTPMPRFLAERTEREPDKHSHRISSDGNRPTFRPWSGGREQGDMSERPVAAANRYRSQDNSKEVVSEERSYYTRKSRADERSEVELDVPVAIPYTTPASEFLYGTSVVSAALKYSGRKLYKFYSYCVPDRVNLSQDATMCKLASSQGVEVMKVQGEWLRIMDKMSTGRPHNVSVSLKLTSSHLNH